MVNNLKAAFKAMLQTNDWMDEKDKKVAAEKVRGHTILFSFAKIKRRKDVLKA